jgi:hypothetical protein
LDGSPAWRVNAHDLEALVCSEMASKLGADRSVLALIGGSDVEADRLKNVLEKADSTASALRSGAAQAKSELLNGLVEQVRLEDDQVTIAINPDRIASMLELAVQALAEDQLTLTVPAIRVRKGHQLRLVIPGSEEAGAPTRQRDHKLIALIAEAHEARKLIMQHRDRSIASIARKQGKCRTRLGRLVVLACMAPAIVKDILQGHQPKSLTAKRLMKIELPFDWDEQRLALGYPKR